METASQRGSERRPKAMLILALLLTLMHSAKIVRAADTEPPEAALSGRVLAADGSAAAGAAVTLLFSEGRDWRQRGPIKADGSGAFSFDHLPADAGDEPPVFQVLAEAEGAGLGLSICDKAQSGVEIRLSKPVRLTVKATDAHDKPMEGVDLRVALLNLPDKLGPMAELPRLESGFLSVRTDKEGCGIIEGLPAGASVMLAHEDKRYAQFGFGTWIALGDGPQIDAGALTMIPAATICGTVRYEGAEGRPAAGVPVHAQTRARAGGNGDAITDAQGRFTLEQMAAGAYDLYAHLNKKAQADWASPPRGNVVAAAGQTIEGQDLLLIKGALIIGRIKAADTGEGLAGLPVGVEPRPRNSAGGERFSDSAADGSFALRVTPGGQHVYLGFSEPPEGFAMGEKVAFDVEVKDGQTLSLDFTLPRAAASDTIAGRVIDAQGNPVAGAEVFLATRGWRFISPQKADAQGRFRLQAPREIKREKDYPTGAGNLIDARLFASAEGDRVTPRGVDVKGGDEKEVTLEVQKHGWAQVSGRVTDEKGKPLPNILVREHISSGTMSGDNRIVRTDDEGRFAVDKVWPGAECVFSAVAKGYAWGGSGRITLQAGERRQLPDWKLASANLSVAGRVVDAKGRPFAGASVLADSMNNEAVQATSDAKGEFRLEGLTEGWLWLMVNNETQTRTRVRVKAGEQNALIELPEPKPAAAEEERYNREEHFAELLGKPVPAMQAAEWINSAPVEPGQLRGKVVLLDFWGVTCGSCLRDMPEEQKFFEANQARGLSMVGIHNAGPAQEVREFLARQEWKVSFPLAMDGKHGATARAYGIVALPTYAVIDREGRLIYLGHEWKEAEAKTLGLLQIHDASNHAQ
jgi:protocatechuate 3,4-dioxygenase beta subunit/thiol-disulfide isomerase/thioredoxin